MFADKILNRVGKIRPTPAGRKRVAVAHAARPVVEALEQRRMLSTYYAPSGTTSIELEPDTGDGPGYVYVYRNNSPSYSYEFSDPSGTDTVDAGGQTVVCKDEVPAVDKPTGGIVFTNASDGTLELDVGVNDTEVDVTSSTSSSAAISIVDSTDSVTGYDSLGTGVPNLTIVANDAGGATVNVPYLATAIHLTVDTGAGTYDTINLGDDDTVTGAVVNTGAGHDTVAVSSDGDDPTTATVDFGAGTGSGDGLGLGNVLNVDNGYCTVTLADNAGDGHTVVVDTVNVTDDSTLIVGSKATIGTLSVDRESEGLVEASGTTIETLDNEGTVAVEAPTTVGSDESSGTTEFTGASDASTVDLVDDSGTVQVDYGAVVTFVGSTESVSDESTFNNLTVAGMAYLQSASTVNNFEQTNGLTELEQSGSWLTNPEANTFDSITITGGKLDIQKQDLVTTTNESTIVGYIDSAYDGGAWDGSGILTDYAVAYPGVYGVGYASAADNSFTGLTLSGSQVLLRPTIAGDANLDGKVDINDLDRVFSDYYTDGDWADGDFNYDGLVDINDLDIVFSNYLVSVGF
jgi:hypothetical protein